MVVSTLNFVVGFVFALGGVAGNLIAYITMHDGVLPGGAPDGPGVRTSAYWLGHMPWSPPWWTFALFGTVMVAVAVLTRDERRRWAPPVTRRTLVWRTSPAILVGFGIALAIVQSVAVSYYDLSRSTVSEYRIGPALCIIAAAIAVSALPRTSARTAPAAKPAGRQARTIAAVSGANIIAFWVLGVFGVTVNQVIYLASHDWRVPEGAEGGSRADLWLGSMPITPPWWVFPLGAVVMLAVVLLTVRRERRYTAAPALFVFRTTPPALAAHSIVISFAMWAVAPLYVEGGGELLAAPASWGLVAVIAFVIALRSPVSKKRSKKRARPQKAGAARG
jgi:hypothetical protein